MSERLELTATYDDPRAYSSRVVAAGGWGRSLCAAPDAEVKLRGIEYIDGAKCWMLQPQLEQRPPDMETVQYAFTGGTGTPALNWVQTSVASAPWKRLAFIRAVADEPLSYATSHHSFALEPGVYVELTIGAPAKGQTLPSYCEIALLDDLAQPWCAIRLHREAARQRGEAADPEVRDRPSLIVWRGGEAHDAGERTAFSAPPGRTLALRLRVIDTGHGQWFHVSGPSASSPLVARLPERSGPHSGRIRFAVSGGSATVYACKSEYPVNPATNYRDGVITEGTQPTTPPLCNGGDTETYAHIWQGGLASVSTGTGPLSCTLTGTATRSPQVIAVTSLHPAQLAAPVTDPTATPALSTAEISLPSHGGGGTARLTFAADDINTTALRPLQWVTISGRWSDDGSPTVLFRGRIGDPKRVLKEEGRSQGQSLALMSDAFALQHNHCVFLDNFWGGFPLTTAAGVLLRDIGVDPATRLVGPALTVRIPAASAEAMRFDRGTTLEAALTALCDACDHDWWVDRLGVFRIAPRPTYAGSVALTIDDTDATFRGLVRRYDLEDSVGRGYGNRALVWDTQTGTYADLADPTATAADGLVLTVPTIGEYGNPVAEARDQLARALAARISVEHNAVLDFGSLTATPPALPRSFVAIGTLSDFPELSSGDILRIEEVRLELDCQAASGAGTAEATYLLARTEAA